MWSVIIGIGVGVIGQLIPGPGWQVEVLPVPGSTGEGTAAVADGAAVAISRPANAAAAIARVLGVDKECNLWSLLKWADD
jgi:hypothetical protein